MIEQNSSKSLSSFFRNFVFGVEDSLVSTVGLLSGVAIAGVARETILLTGTVLIFVEAFSMAAGSFLAEYSVEEYESRERADFREPVMASFVMFVSYFISGFIPLFPYLIWESPKSFVWSIVFSLLALFLLGIIGAKISGRNLFRRGIRMLIVGGLAVLVGVLAGRLGSSFNL